MKIFYVDGFQIRNTLDSDFGLIDQFSDQIADPYPKFYIPKGEVWIDQPFHKETDFLLQVENFYTDPANFETIKHAKSQSKLFDEKRNFLKKLCSPPPVPDYIQKKETRDGLSVVYVDGSIIRKFIDPEFSFGGHDLVYSYIPKSEVWIDSLMDIREFPYVILHEITERQLMEKDGKSYDIAHEMATVAERETRIKDGLGMYPSHYTDYRFMYQSNEQIIKENYLVSESSEPQTPTSEPQSLKVVPFQQSSAFCGPASLKILLSYFGKEFTEAQLGLLCDATRESGSEHEGLVEAIKTIGGYVFVKEGGTVEELEYFIKVEKLPVIIGWFDKDGDHYSVLVNITAKNIIIVDPAVNVPERWIDKASFPSVWFDFSGKDSRTVTWGWYMVISFNKQRYKVAGGHYY